MSRVFTCRDVRHNMPVTQGFYAFIAVPSISPNFRSPLHTIQHEFVKAHHRYIWNDRHTYSTCTTPSNFCCYSYDRLSLSATTADFRPTASNVSFINFNSSGQLVSSGAYHRTTQFMKPNPCSIVTAKTEDPLQPKSTGSMFLTRHKPHGKKPCPKWFVSSMKQRSRSNGCLTFTVSAQKQTTPHQRRLLCIAPATRTTETFRPSKFRNIVKASIFAAKPLIKLLERSRIINAGHGLAWLFHNHILHLVAG